MPSRLLGFQRRKHYARGRCTWQATNMRAVAVLAWHSAAAKAAACVRSGSGWLGNA